MASPRYKKNTFLVANLLFWTIGMGLLAYTFWLIFSEYSQTESLNALIGSSQVFTYTLLGISAVLCAVGLCGCFGGIEQSLLCLRIYLIFMVVVLLGEIGVAFFLHSTDDQMTDYVSAFWSDANTETRNFIQRELKCCGLTGPQEYARFLSVDSSCYNVTNDVTQSPAVLYQVGCRDGILDWLRGSTPIWASALSIIVFIEIFALCLSCCVISSVEKQMKVNVDKPEAESRKNAKEKEGDENIVKKHHGPVVSGQVVRKATEIFITEQPKEQINNANDK